MSKLKDEFEKAFHIHYGGKREEDTTKKAIVRGIALGMSTWSAKWIGERIATRLRECKDAYGESHYFGNECDCNEMADIVNEFMKELE